MTVSRKERKERHQAEVEAYTLMLRQEVESIYADRNTKPKDKYPAYIKYLHTLKYVEGKSKEQVIELAFAKNKEYVEKLSRNLQEKLKAATQKRKQSKKKLQVASVPKHLLKKYDCELEGTIVNAYLTILCKGLSPSMEKSKLEILLFERGQYIELSPTPNEKALKLAMDVARMTLSMDTIDDIK